MARAKSKLTESKSSRSDQALKLLRSWDWQEHLPRLESRAESPEAALILGFQALENGDLPAAQKHLERAIQEPEFEAWSRAGQALAALRGKEFQNAHRLLDAIREKELAGDAVLAALAAHVRGSVHYHEGNAGKALSEFERALELAPENHLLRGRILDSLGKHYAGFNNFTAAREFLAESLKRKERAGDLNGVAFAHGSLGRLMLDWGFFKEAREHFLKDLELVRGKDLLAEAQMYNFLGRVELDEGRFDDAAGWLDESVARAAELGATWLEGFARKDRARVHLARNEFARAEEQLDQAAALLNFAEGKAHVERTRALIRREEKRFNESEALLRKSLAHFEASGESSEAAQTLLEEARTLRARGAPPAVLRHALERALSAAESCRRTRLVREAEAEMRAADVQQLVLHAYKRASGKNIEDDAVNLFDGVPETVTVLFLDLKNSTEFVTSHDPRWVLMALNQIFAELESVLGRHRAFVNQYLGDGFMAYFRGADHAPRAVSAALDLSRAIEALNRPRALLKLPRFDARMGIATGEVVLGHIGTFRKFDFTAVGAATNLAARLQSEAEEGAPCIARATHERAAKLFTFKNAKGRNVELKGFGEQRVWDVMAGIGTQILPRKIISSGSPDKRSGQRSPGR